MDLRPPQPGLQPVNRLADQDMHRNPAVLRPALWRFVIRQRVALGHAGGGQHAVGLPAAGLLQIVDHPARAPLAPPVNSGERGGEVTGVATRKGSGRGTEGGKKKGGSWRAAREKDGGWKPPFRAARYAWRFCQDHTLSCRFENRWRQLRCGS